MPSTFSNLGLELQATGENANTWGSRTNVGLQRIDNAIAGYAAVSCTTTSIILTFSTNAASTTFTDENGRNKILKFTDGTPGGPVTVTVPDIEKEYLVENQSGQNITFSAGGSTTVTIGTDRRAHIYVDGASAVFNAYEKMQVSTLQASSIAVSGSTTFTLPTTDGSNGQAIVTNGSGTLSFADAGIGTGKAIAMAIVFG